MDKPALTVPNLMMAAVALGGLYVVYRMTQTSSAQQDGGQTNQPQAGVLEFLGSPLHLGNNRFYRGRIETKPDDNKNLPPFLATASYDELVRAFNTLGFSNVHLYMDASQLPAGDWPEQAKQGATSLTRFFEAQWPLPTGDVPRPADITLMWVAKPPAGATYSATTPSTKVSGETSGMRLVVPEMRWTNPPSRWGNAPPTFIDDGQAVG